LIIKGGGEILLLFIWRTQMTLITDVNRSTSDVLVKDIVALANLSQALVTAIEAVEPAIDDAAVLAAIAALEAQVELVTEVK
jgi:hypothetical protein